jgi:hypothetical protein
MGWTSPLEPIVKRVSRIVIFKKNGKEYVYRLPFGHSAPMFLNQSVSAPYANVAAPLCGTVTGSFGD